MEKKIQNALERLDAWFQKQGFSGWDPYDLKASRVYMAVQQLRFGVFGRLIRKCFNLLTDLFPIASRWLLGVKPLKNAKGMGLLLGAYSTLYMKTGNQKYLERALNYASWLETNRGEVYRGYNWGYPFDWQSNVFIPQGTPSSVVTSTVGNGFFLLYQATQDTKYLNICKEICSFFLNDLKVTYQEGDKLCFSYTPLDDFQVHNANLFVGEFLTRVGDACAEGSWVETGRKCAMFALFEQKKEGYLPYWGLEQTDRYSSGFMKVDHYHSGFEIRMLYSIWKITHDEKIGQAWKQYFEWYRAHLFTSDGLPKLTPKSFYPVNIHAVAEAILCLTVISEEDRTLDPTIEMLIEWSQETLEYRPGEYAYMIKKMPLLGAVKIKIPMFRWGQAWMLYALSCQLKSESV